MQAVCIQKKTSSMVWKFTNLKIFRSDFLYLMFPILHKLTSTSREQCMDAIVQRYDHQGFVVVNYLYGAMIVQHRLLDIHNSGSSLALQQSLLFGDFLLPDGAALRTFWLIRQTLVRCSYFSRSTT